MGLNITATERSELCSAIVKKKSCSVSYVEAVISYIQTLETSTITPSLLNELPSTDNELIALEFKHKFIDTDNGKNLLKTFVGLATIQKQNSITFFTKKQIIEYYYLMLQKYDVSLELDEKIVEKLLNYFTKIGNLYTFSSYTFVNSLLNPNKVFNEEKVENFPSKKLFLTIQNYFTNLLDFNYIDLFKELLVSLLESHDKLDVQLSLLYLIAVDNDFNKKLKNISFTNEKLFSMLLESKKNESEALKKSFIESTDYFLYMLEKIFDRYLVKVMYETSNNIMVLLDNNLYELLDTQHKIRFNFQKARQLIANGNVKQSNEE